MSVAKDTHGSLEPLDFVGDMKACRLTNTHHTDILNCLPLPSLPLNFGARNSELQLHDESDPATLVGPHFESELSRKLVELLRSTDVGYMCMREHSTISYGSGSGPRNEGSYEASVLDIDPEAFSNRTPEIHGGKRLRSRSAETKGFICAGSHLIRNHAGNCTHLSQPTYQSPHASSLTDVQTPPTSKKQRMTRTRSTALDGNQTTASKAGDPADLGDVSSLCRVLDELCDYTKAGGDNGVGEAGSCLGFFEMKGLSEDVVKVRAKDRLHVVPPDYLLKLLALLDRHVRWAGEVQVDGEDGVDSGNTSPVFIALEAVHLSLIVMTHPGMPKEVYKEENIERIITFTRLQIGRSLFKAHDPVYKHLCKGAAPEAEEDYSSMEMSKGDLAVDCVRKSGRKVKLARACKPDGGRVSRAIASVLHKLCSILALLKDLLVVERFPDSGVLQLTKAVLATFCVDNVQLLQLKAIGVACSVFSSYPQHRSFIVEECVSMFWKLPSSKRNMRAYLLSDEEPKQVQMLTALLLQLVQCSVRLPDLEAETTAAGSSAFSTKCLDPAMDTCKNFWKLVLQRWAAPKSQDSIDVKGVVENIVVDLLTTLNAPEFPAASLLLQILCILLFSTAGLKSKDSIVRGAAIELFGLIASRLKQDAISCSNDSLWILAEVHSKPTGSSSGELRYAQSRMQGCAVCQAAGRGSKNMVSCAQCERLFHGDCIGIGGQTLISQGWLCCCCLCKKQLLSFAGDGKPSAVGDVIYQKHAINSDLVDGRTVLQQLLLNYLQEVAQSDNLAEFARGFYLCQWYRDEPVGSQNLEFNLKRLSARTPAQEFGVAWNSCSRNIMVRLSAVLGQERPLAKGFDRILERLLTSLQENISGPRAKALRAVSALVEVDPTVLGDERVRVAVEGRFLDSAILVREAAMELVGRHIVRLPNVAEKYFDNLAERIMDTGVSVRKRVIKIIRDVCVANTGFAKSTDACVKIISRINDEETSIQDLVGRTFFELWFEEMAVQHSHLGGDGTHIPPDVVDRTQQIVDVLKKLGNCQPIVTVIKRSLALDFASQSAKTAATISGSQASVRKRCELMCKCLLESILKAEESSSEGSETRALPYVLALHAFCTVDPTLCAPPADPSCFVVTLLPYLKAQVHVDTQVVSQLLQSIVFVVETVLPMLRRPPQGLVDELEQDLKSLVNRNPFQAVIHACIKCVAALSKISGKGVTAYQALVRRNIRILDLKRDHEVVGVEKANVLRSIYCIGMLSRYCPDLIDSMTNEGIKMETVLLLLKHYLKSSEIDIKCRALQALGVFCISRPNFMLEMDIGKILEASLGSTANERLKLQTLRNFCDYLSHVEEQMGASESGKDKVSIRGGATTTVVPVAAGAGDSNIAGGIIQLHWELILERCLDMNQHVRLSALKVLEIVLRQGLVHPMSCVPQLIALEVDQEESISKLAHRLVVLMNDKYPSFFESRLGDGLHLSFDFMLSGATTSTEDASQQRSFLLSKVKAKAGISRIYKLIRNNRSARNKFLGSILRKYDTATAGHIDSGKSGTRMASFLVYCAEILASLPFSTSDEPLYVVFSINRIVQVRGGSLEATIKAIIAEEPLASVATRILDTIAADRAQEELDAYDYNSNSLNSQKIEVCDEAAEIPQEFLNKLKENCHSAMALALLLQLKRHLKVVYGLTDVRCQAFMPSECVRSVEVFQRKENIKEFSTKAFLLEENTTVRHMLEQYQTFKRLLKEDSVDYSAFATTVSKKRGRQIHAETVHGSNHGDSHPPPRTLRRKGALSRRTVDCDTDFEPEDDDDGDWTKRQKAGVSKGKGRAKKSAAP